MFGPLIVVGPKASTDRVDFQGELIVPVDGSDFSETMLSLGAAWGIGLGARPWVVEVVAPDQVQVEDATEGSYAARLARDIRRTSHHDVQFEVLHGKRPGKAIADFADSIEASLIVASTHGRTGLARLTLGSVAMEIVRHAPCPVVLTRPPTLQRVSERP
jgi:nucleotide-binding universal stress UspA family protein